MNATRETAPRPADDALTQAWFDAVEAASRLSDGFVRKYRRRSSPGTLYRVVGCCLREEDAGPCVLCLRVGDRASVKLCLPLADFQADFEEVANA